MQILHVVPDAERRGGPVFASDLIASLTEDGVKHRVALLRDKKGSSVRFDAPTRVLGDGRFELPGLHIDLRAIRALRSLVDTWKPDIVQAHGGETFKYAVAAGLHRKAPVVLRAIGAAPPWIRHGPRRSAYRVLMRKSAQVVAVAETLRRETIHIFGVPESRVVTIPNGVDSRRLRPERGREETRKLLGIPGNHRMVLSLGALTWEKDPLTQLQVSARIIEHRRLVTHVIAGDGPMRRQVEQVVTRAGLNGHVLVLGSRTDVADLLSAADIMLFASGPDGMEGMPATIIEAGMMARPVVAYAVAGVPEVVESGTTGLLVTPGDVDALTDRTMQLLDDEGARREMGEAAQRRCVSLFDIRSVAQQYLWLYEQIVDSL